MFYVSSIYMFSIRSPLNYAASDRRPILGFGSCDSIAINVRNIKIYIIENVMGMKYVLLFKKNHFKRHIRTFQEYSIIFC